MEDHYVLVSMHANMVNEGKSNSPFPAAHLRDLIYDKKTMYYLMLSA